MAAMANAKGKTEVEKSEKQGKKLQICGLKRKGCRVIDTWCTCVREKKDIIVGEEENVKSGIQRKQGKETG